MARKNGFHGFISSSDQNILNAFNQLNDINPIYASKNCISENTNSSNNVSNSSCGKVIDSGVVSSNGSCCSEGDSTNSSNLSSSTAVSRLFDDESCCSVRFDPMYVELSENFSTINKMFHSLNEQKDKWQEENETFKKKLFNGVVYETSTSELRKRLERINLVIEHLKEISDKVSKLKHALRTVDQSDCLKIHIDYHKNVINFFDMAKMIIEDLDDDIMSFMCIKDPQSRESANMELVKKVNKLTTMLYKSIDTLKEFKDYMQTLML